MIEFFKRTKLLSSMCLISFIISIARVLSANMPELFDGAEGWFAFVDNLSLAYIASYLFYIVQVYLPEKHQEDKNIPLRAAVQREVQFFATWIVGLCIAYYDYAISKGTMDKIEKNVDSIFDEEKMMKILNVINLSDSSTKVLNNDTPESWKRYIKRELDKIIMRGEKIVAYRAAELPPDIYYAVSYLTTESSMVCVLNRVMSIYNSNTNLFTGMLFVGDLIPKDMKTDKKDISMDMESIKKLIQWVNSECDYLQKQKKYSLAHICRIDVESYAKW